MNPAKPIFPVKGYLISSLILLAMTVSCLARNNIEELSRLSSSKKILIFYNETTDWKYLNWVINECLGGENLSGYFYSISNDADPTVSTTNAQGVIRYHARWPIIPLRTMATVFNTDTTDDPFIVVLFVRNITFLNELNSMVEGLFTESVIYFDHLESKNDANDYLRTSCLDWSHLRDVKFCARRLSVVETDFYRTILVSSTCKIGVIETPTKNSGSRFYKKIIDEHFNFLSACNLSTDPEGYGKMEKSGQYSGLMGKIVREDIDLIFSVRPTTTRLRYVDFTIPMEYDAQIYIYRDTDVIKPPNMSSLLLPYEIQIWIIIGLCYVTCFFLAYLLSYNPKLDTFQWTLYDSALYFYQALVMQPGSSNMIRVRGVWKFVGLWWFFTTVVSTGYGAKLISFITSSLTTNHHVDDLDSLGDMIEQEGYKVGTVRNSLTHYSLENQIRDYHQDRRAIKNHDEKSPYFELMHHITNMSKQMEHCATVEEGIRKMLKEKYVFIESENAIEQSFAEMKLSQQQSLHFDQERLMGVVKSIAVQKGSILVYLINRIFRQNQESGLYSKWTRDVEERVRARGKIKTESVEREDTVEEYSSLKLDSIVPVLRLCVCLNSVSIVVCFCEYLAGKTRSYLECRARRRRKTFRRRNQIKWKKCKLFPIKAKAKSKEYEDDPMGLRLIRNAIRRKNRLEMEFYHDTNNVFYC